MQQEARIQESIKLFSEGKEKEGYADFLCFAAQPMLFSTDLLYQLWANFKSYCNKNPKKQASYYVVSDLILSGLCRPIGTDLFRMDDDIRNHLVKKSENQEIKKVVAHFVAQYAAYNKAKLLKNVYEIYLLWAKAITNPREMEKMIVENMKNATNDYQKLNYLTFYFNALPADAIGEQATQITLEIADKADEEGVLNVVLPQELRGRVKEKEKTVADLQVDLPKSIGKKNIIKSKQQKKGLNLEEFKLLNNYVADEYISEKQISFLGRTEEMQKITEFLKSNKRILELVGVPMIGKTTLTKEYCKQYKIKHIRITFRQKPYTPFIDLEEQLFGKGQFNDFSGIEKGTLLVIENFEQALNWTTQDNNLHEITAKGITDFLNKLVEKDCKLLIETRFQIRFDRDFQKYFVQTLQIQGIDTALFWDYYLSKNFTSEQFADLCQKFDNHTGLLALAYNDAGWLYENELVKAIYEPTATSRNLWKLLEVIIKKLGTAEIQILAALTLWQKPISKQELQTILQGYFTANFDKTLEALKKKLLVLSYIQNQDLAYALNPYLAEVFFAFMENSAELIAIKKLPAFQQIKSNNFEYDKIRQAHIKGNYKIFFDWIKEQRKAGNYYDVINMLQSVYLESPIPEVILNEIGITYKWQKKYREAKEVLQKACELGNIKSFNELGIIYKQEGNFEEAKKVLLKAIDLGHIPAMNELGIVYKAEGNFEEAKKVLQKACELGNIQSFTELGIIYKEEGNFEEAKKVLQKALAIEPNNVRVLNELGIVYKEEGNFEEAKKVLQKACELGNIQSFNKLAIVYKEEGNFEEAKKVLLKAIDLGHIPAMNELGIVYKEEGNFAKALETVEKGLTIEPNNKYLATVKRSILQAQKANQFMQPSIQKAIAALQNANYSGYFEEMDNVVPQSLQKQFSEFRMQFISGNITWKFAQQLEDFTKFVDKVLKTGITEITEITDRKERVEAIKKQLLMNSKLKSDWETIEILAENPIEKMKCEMEIEKLNAKIKSLKEELTKLI